MYTHIYISKDRSEFLLISFFFHLGCSSYSFSSFESLESDASCQYTMSFDTFIRVACLNKANAMNYRIYFILRIFKGGHRMHNNCIRITICIWAVYYSSALDIHGIRHTICRRLSFCIYALHTKTDINRTLNTLEHINTFMLHVLHT